MQGGGSLLGVFRFFCRAGLLCSFFEVRSSAVAKSVALGGWLRYGNVCLPAFCRRVPVRFFLFCVRRSAVVVCRTSAVNVLHSDATFRSLQAEVAAMEVCRKRRSCDIMDSSKTILLMCASFLNVLFW